VGYLLVHYRAPNKAVITAKNTWRKNDKGL
jgi:hypothetical protein